MIQCWLFSEVRLGGRGMQRAQDVTCKPRSYAVTFKQAQMMLHLSRVNNRSLKENYFSNIFIFLLKIPFWLI